MSNNRNSNIEISEQKQLNIYISNNIYIRFGSKLYRQIVSIPMVLTVPLL